MPNDTLFDNFAVFKRDTDSKLSAKEESRLNEIFRNILDWPTTVVVERFLAQVMSADLDMGGYSITNIGGVDGTTAAFDILLKDNEAAAFAFKEAANSYLTFVTLDGAELVKIHKAFYAEANMYMAESAAAAADVAAYGQVWVKDDAPNTLWFTDDTGVDTQLGVGGGESFHPFFTGGW